MTGLRLISYKVIKNFSTLYFKEDSATNPNQVAKHWQKKHGEITLNNSKVCISSESQNDILLWKTGLMKVVYYYIMVLVSCYFFNNLW